MLVLPCSEGELIKQALGQDWDKLHADIRQRFTHTANELFYQGTMTRLWCSGFGKCLAYLSYPLIKGALLPHRVSHIPIKIKVFRQQGRSKIFKSRWYYIKPQQPICFTSAMLLDDQQHLIEYVGGGLGMYLQTSVQNEQLMFHSTGYFWQIAGYQFSLPAWLTPGETILTHQNVDARHFLVNIQITHCWFGLSFVQEGLFEESNKESN